MRTFLALPLPPPPALKTVLEDLRSCGADLKVVAEANLHLTLKFLGEIREDQGPVILDRLRTSGFPTDYDVRIKDVGAFPDWKKFNVLWAGVEDAQGHIGRTYALAEQAFAALGFEPDAKPFRAHLTIARKRSDRDKEEAKRVLTNARGADFGLVRVDAPILFKSTLGPSGPTYEALGKAVG